MSISGIESYGYDGFRHDEMLERVIGLFVDLIYPSYLRSHGMRQLMVRLIKRHAE